MEVDCQGCAGCCIDWRTLAPVAEHERGGSAGPLDDAYNMVPLTRDDVTELLEVGYASAMTPRLWTAETGPSVEIDGYDLVAIDDLPAFFLGLRHVHKPVDPFGTEPAWLPTCVFLDPDTLQCRIHDAPEYPEECAAYPGDNLSLGAETECERVEEHFGGSRLLDDLPPEESGPLLGRPAIGQRIFVYPEPEALEGTIQRLVDDRLTREDRATFIAAAAASAPGTTAIEEHRFESAFEAATEQRSWIEDVLEEWEQLAPEADPEPQLARSVEVERGAPTTPGWEG